MQASQSLEWRTLEQRRVDSRLCMLYKIRNHIIAVEEEHYVQRGTVRHSHQYRQIKIWQRLHTFLFLSQNHYPLESTLQPDLHSRVAQHLQDPGPENRASKTINFQDIFYRALFALSFFFFLSILIFCYSVSSFSFFSHFPSCTLMVKILKVEDIPYTGKSK